MHPLEASSRRRPWRASRPSALGRLLAFSWVARLAWVACVVVGALAGCQPEASTPDLLRVVDVLPREVDLGDKLEVVGVHLPASESQTAQVVFKGTLRRAGRAPLREQEIVVEAASLSSIGVRVPVREELLERFCGRGDEAQHTTFLGSVTVSIPGTPVRGTVHGVSLDLRPLRARRAVQEAREAEARKALEFLGLSLDAEGVGPLGALVGAVRPLSPAQRAGLEPGDRLLALDGVNLRALEDLIPSGEARTTTFSVRRGEEAPSPRVLSLEGYLSSAPRDLLGAQVVLGSSILLLLFYLSPLAGLLAWLERRALARTRARLRAPGGRQPRSTTRALFPRLGSILREELGLPSLAGGSSLAPAMTFVGVSCLLASMPFARRWLRADLDIGALVLLSTSSVFTLALLVGGRAPSARVTLRVRGQAALQVLAYSVPLLLCVVALVLVTGSLRLGDLVALQAGAGGPVLERGAWAWSWQLFRNPANFSLTLLYLAASWVAGGRPPRPLLGSATSPTASTPSSSRTEPASSEPWAGRERGALFFLAEWAQLQLFCGLGVALLAGGWQLPGLSLAQQQGSMALQLLGTLLFLLKAWSLLLLVLLARWALPRPRAEEGAKLCWRYLLPATLVCGGLAVGVSRLPLPPTARLALGLVTFTTASVLVLALVWRSARGLRSGRWERIHLSPRL